jgi:DNA-binding PadR family transcriptional regulator
MTRPASKPQSEQTVGLFGYVVLKAVHALVDDAYGLKIARLLYDLTGSIIIPGRVYLTLQRLESRKFLAKREEQREGSSRKTIVYTITPEGITQIAMADLLVTAVAKLEKLTNAWVTSEDAAPLDGDRRGSNK